MISGSDSRRSDAAPPLKVVAAETKGPPRGGRLDSGEPGRDAEAKEAVGRPLCLNVIFICEWAARIRQWRTRRRSAASFASIAQSASEKSGLRLRRIPVGGTISCDPIHRGPRANYLGAVDALAGQDSGFELVAHFIRRFG
jgi:hypothetical protein